jgi:AraC family transcriptional regulator
VSCFQVDRFSHGGTTIARCTCDGRDPARPQPNLSHEDKLVITLRGRFSYRHRRGRLAFDPSRAIMQRAGEEYVSHHPDGGDESLVVTGSALAASFDAWQVIPLDVDAQVRIHDLAARLEAGPVDPLEVDETLSTLCAEVDRSPPRRAGAGRWRAQADEIAHEVAMRFDQPLPLAALAARVGVSPFAACRLFRQATGSTIHQYQVELRLRHALTLLFETGRPLADIALATGFANQGHFGNHFRRRYGLTPGRARTPEGKRALVGSLPR